MEIRRKPTATPKPPTASQLRQQEEAEGRMAYEEAKKTGIGGQAIDYWERAEKQVEKNVSDGKTHWVVGGFEATGAKVMGFFARLANIHEVEGRAAQLGY
jgi:hypothetical protein